MIYLDTHVVVWLYGGLLERFTPAGLSRLEAEELLVSPMVVLELEFLREVGRLKVPASTLVEGLSGSIGLQVCSLPFHHVVLEALLQNWTRDPFDRLIVGHARARGAPLLTKDARIRKHYGQAVWA
ncbi:MAG: type II toxin-antitoxin system VapC family toxin [Planctomycetes bacterium]|nr:type II toxin-antitoxin system VapC family toxin [Planctomycetota bacterium]